MADYACSQPSTSMPGAPDYIQRANPAFEAVLATRTASHAAGFFLPYLRPGMRVLDVGCGPGSITLGLAEAVAPGAVVGIDLQPAQVEQARAFAATRGVTNVRYEVADLYALPFPDVAFDAAFAHTVVIGLREPVRALAELRRVLRPGGLVGVRDPDWGTWGPGAGGPAGRARHRRGGAGGAAPWRRPVPGPPPPPALAGSRVCAGRGDRVGVERGVDRGDPSPRRLHEGPAAGGGPDGPGGGVDGSGDRGGGGSRDRHLGRAPRRVRHLDVVRGRGLGADLRAYEGRGAGPRSPGGAQPSASGRGRSTRPERGSAGADRWRQLGRTVSWSRRPIASAPASLQPWGAAPRQR
jgi:SAM-dependent methyltransferase